MKTIATEGEGIEALLETVQEHQTYQIEAGTLAARERARVAFDLETRLREVLLEQLLERIGPELFEETIEEVLARRLDPHTAVAGLVQKVGPAAQG
jgi:LAO/AO transport system kinase